MAQHLRRLSLPTRDTCIYMRVGVQRASRAQRAMILLRDLVAHLVVAEPLEGAGDAGHAEHRARRGDPHGQRGDLVCCERHESAEAAGRRAGRSSSSRRRSIWPSCLGGDKRRRRAPRRPALLHQLRACVAPTELTMRER